MTEQSQAFRLGVLMLDTRFPRFPGEVGHAESFTFPVDYERIPQASVARVVSGEPLPKELQEAFFSAARRLSARGASLIATSCGFLAPLQSELARVSGRPVITSSLVLLPLLRSVFGPEATLAILTFDAAQLGPQHLPKTEGPLGIGGLEEGNTLYPAISGDLTELDPAKAEADALACAGDLCQESPRPSALLLECTNLSPYKRALRAALALPVYDIVDAILWHAQAAGWQAR